LRSYNPDEAVTSPVWALPRSLATTRRITVVFSSTGYLDVSVPRVRLQKLCIHSWMMPLHGTGFPHSDIRGSKLVRSSPRLFAAYHVLHRLLMPGHPPCARSRLKPHAPTSAHAAAAAHALPVPLGTPTGCAQLQTSRAGSPLTGVIYRSR
jgi:hypothetical protein